MEILNVAADIFNVVETLYSIEGLNIINIQCNKNI